MAVQKPSIPKGTRDFSPEEMAKRNYIFKTIRGVFRTYGFREIETPAMENLGTLTGKYGEEGDKLLFRILNSGDMLKSFDRDELKDITSSEFASRACDRGLRYDLTVPFARYVVQHRNDLTFPFRRFQIQPVWRADRPQKGRYREFFQCDADVIGSDSLLHEVELTRILDSVFRRLGVNVDILLNNRKILSGIAEVLGVENILDLTIAIDKLDKIGWDKVQEELISKGITQDACDKLEPIISLDGTNKEKLERMRLLFANSEVGLKGVEEMEYILDILSLGPIKNKVKVDLSLARGLDYYTGTIFEVKAQDVEMGSISGGGRYDNLTGVFGLDGMSGVGISFGADRIFDVLNQLDLYPKGIGTGSQLLFINFGDKSIRYIIPILQVIRRAGISAELYPDEAKMNKQMKYANALNIPYVAFVGDDEIDSRTISLKNMETGEQKTYTLETLIELLKS